MGISMQVRPGVPTPDREHRAVGEHVDRWETAELLTHEQAERIRAFEQAEASLPGRRIPLVAEMVGYVGVALVAAAALTLFSRFWDEMSSSAQLGLFAAGTLIFLLAGWPIRHSVEPAFTRLAGVLWTASVAGLFGFMLTLLFTRPEIDEPAAWAVFALGVVVGAYARVLLVLRASSLLQVALFAATLAAVGGVGNWAIEEGWEWLDQEAATVFAVALVVVSALWVAAGRFEVLAPRTTAYCLGALGASYAPVLVMQDATGAGLLTGVAVAAAVLGASVWLRSVPPLAIGAVGLFGYVTGCSVYFLADTAGLPIALLLSGLVLVAIALIVVRLRRFTQEPLSLQDRSSQGRP